MYCQFTTEAYGKTKFMHKCKVCERKLVSDKAVVLIKCKIYTKPSPFVGIYSSDYGVGTELHDMLEKFGFKSNNVCKCETHVKKMNRNGHIWCKNNVDMIVGWLKSEAEARGYPFVEFAATLLVKRAIRNFEKKYTIDLTRVLTLTNKLYNPSQVQGMIDSINKNEPLPQILIFKTSDGSLHCLDGHHRLTSYYLAGHKYLTPEKYRLVTKPDNYKAVGTVTDIIQWLSSNS